LDADPIRDLLDPGSGKEEKFGSGKEEKFGSGIGLKSRIRNTEIKLRYSSFSRLHEGLHALQEPCNSPGRTLILIKNLRPN
jgi:hypothetical protein